MKRQSAPSKKRLKLIPIEGHPGLFTFESFEITPKMKRESKKVVDKIMRDAERMRKEEDKRIEKLFRSLGKTIQGVG